MLWERSEDITALFSIVLILQELNVRTSELFSPEVRFIEARTATGNDRARRFFGTDSFDPSRLRTAKRAIEDRIRVSRDDFRTLEDLNNFIQTRANELQLTVPRPVKVLETPEVELETLFQELVGGRSRKAAHQPEILELDRAFHVPSLENRIQFDLQIKIPVLGRQLDTLSYALPSFISKWLSW